MLKGSLLAESLRIGAGLDVAGLRVTRLSRRDVSASASAAQPTVWTFLDLSGLPPKNLVHAGAHEKYGEEPPAEDGLRWRGQRR
jgi:hypothetical protein